jgi:DNA-binding response OmpR family regulator
MGLATVLLVGIDDLPTIPDYLRLGAVVVVAPDREILVRWQSEARGPAGDGGEQLIERGGLVIDLIGRQILHEEHPLSLSELEFRVLAALVARPGRAWSFADLRGAGWDDELRISADVEAVRALVQRLRGKLEVAGVPLRIEAVRGFGFRASPRSPVPPGGAVSTQAPAGSTDA